MAVPEQKHLLVDGANIMHAWPDLRALLKRDRENARRRLSQAMRLLHDAEALRVTVVFDGRGEELSVEHPGGQATFAHIYTPTGTTADDVIAQLVSRARSAADCLVATDDRGERLAIEALGAGSISSADLATWLARADQRQQSRLQERRRENDAQWRAPGA